jgi:hypothetical protein
MSRGIEQRAQALLDRVNPRIDLVLVVPMVIAMVLVRPGRDDDVPSMTLYKLTGLLLLSVLCFGASRSRFPGPSLKGYASWLLLMGAILSVSATVSWLSHSKPTPWLDELAIFIFYSLQFALIVVILTPILKPLLQRFNGKLETPAKTTSFTLSKNRSTSFRLTREA